MLDRLNHSLIYYIRANYLDEHLSIVLQGSDSGIVQPHLGDDSSLQRVTSVLSKRSGVPQRGVLPVGLRIARDAMHRGAISDSIVVIGPRSNARTIRRGAMPRINSTVYEDERATYARSSGLTSRDRKLIAVPNPRRTDCLADSHRSRVLDHTVVSEA